MLEIGESSHVKVEFTDIHMDTVHPVKVEPTESVEPEMTDDSSDSEGHVPEAEEAIRGRVTRSGNEDDEDKMEPYFLPEELSVEYTDGMGTTAGDIIEELTNRNEELEDRVQHLEEENRVHQEMEDHYREAACQLQHEVDVMKMQLQRTEQLEAEKETLRQELEMIQTFWDEEEERRVLAVRQRDEAMNRIHDLENEVRNKSARNGNNFGVNSDSNNRRGESSGNNFKRKRFNNNYRRTTAPAPTPAPPPVSREGDRPPVKCYKCGQEGHISPNCTQQSKLCYSCGRKGHLARFCPEIKSSPAEMMTPKANTDKGKPVVQERAFVVTSQKEWNPNEVITGK